MQPMPINHQSTSLAVHSQNKQRPFPIISAELQIRVPDCYVGRLIGKNGVSISKIMDETGSHISVRNFSDKDAANHVDRIITIKGATLDSALAAEKRVSARLGQNFDSDMNSGINNYNYSMNHASTAGYSVAAAMENVNMIPHQYITAASGTPSTISRENAAAAAAAYNSIAAYNSLPITVSGPIYYQHPNQTAYPINAQPIGYAAAQPQTTNPIHIKSRLYVPESVVGSLIGAKGQNIKSMMNMTQAIIMIDADSGRKDKREVKSQSQVIEEENKDEHACTELKDDVFDDAKGGVAKLNISNDGGTCALVDENTITLENGKTTPPTAAINEETKHEHGEGILDAAIVDGKANGGSSQATSSKGQTLPHSVTPKRVQSETDTNNGNNGNERSVMISGYDYQVYGAQSMIFHKVSDNTRRHVDELSLHCDMIVPTKIIGRIIGKGGANVRELQRVTNALVRIPDTTLHNGENIAETPVRLTGTFGALRYAQQRIGLTIAEIELKESKEYEVKRSARNSSSSSSRPPLSAGYSNSAAANATAVQKQLQQQKSPLNCAAAAIAAGGKCIEMAPTNGGGGGGGNAMMVGVLHQSANQSPTNNV